jgi:hypothetical protein
MAYFNYPSALAKEDVSHLHLWFEQRPVGLIGRNSCFPVIRVEWTRKAEIPNSFAELVGPDQIRVS